MNVQRRLSQASVGLVIAGLHLAGVLVWWSTQLTMQLAPSNTRLTSIAVWLPAPAKPDTAQTRRAPHAPDATSAPGRRDFNKPAIPSHTTDVWPTPTSNGVSLATEAPGSSDTPAPAAPALNLTLSRKDITSAAPRSFAEQSPFRGRLPKTVERQIASAAAETGPWTEERIDNDHIRFRRGNTCVMMQRPRAASIDPMNEAAARTPWRASVEACGD